MKKGIALVLCLLLVVPLAACGVKPADTRTEEVPVDYGDAVTVAQDAFQRAFSEYANLKITETSTMARTTSTERLVVQFRYSSDNGDGVYGFEIEKTATGSYDIIRQGEDVTMDDLVGEP